MINYDGLEASFSVRPDTYDQLVIDQIFKTNFYLTKGYEVHKGDIVIDIGGHIGIFSVQAGLYGGKVYVFEPDIDNYKLLKKNIGLNKLKMNIYNLAVSSIKGEIDFYLSKDNVAGHSVWENKNSTKIKVKSTTLDLILNKLHKCDLLKLDCEGSEYNILFNSDLTKVQKIVMEYHDIKKALKLSIYLMEQGFGITKFCGDHRLGLIQCKR